MSTVTMSAVQTNGTALHIADEPILLRTDNSGVTTLKLNRPKQFNVLSLAMLGALQSELDDIATDVCAS